MSQNLLMIIIYLRLCDSGLWCKAGRFGVWLSSQCSLSFPPPPATPPNPFDPSPPVSTNEDNDALRCITVECLDDLLIG